MIHPPDPTTSGSGAAFSDAADGDIRGDVGRRSGLARGLGIPGEWATLTQVHGSVVIEVDRPGDHGEADAMFTSQVGLPLAIFTADCAGVVIHAPGAVGVAHAGWRGAASGVVEALVTDMRRAGFNPRSAAVGPTLGPCCLEVGPEVSALFEGFTASTTWNSRSVDLLKAVEAQLPGLEIWSAGNCTLHEPGWFSHRRDRTQARMAAIGWLTSGPS
jgi:YfiH family protein